jgi:hypothetical protein
MATAILLPPRVRAIDALREASQRRGDDPGIALYTNGERLAWLTHPPRGWSRIGGGIKAARPC